ncbi:hypothetical protein ABIB80_006877 [Bradyrhizobium sp. i1.15.2]|uniref:hypothetical protein n=1 Tax=Bradyrhizobium sp. i1.15.2 TaxID=3156362 RepID=UPI00339B16FD
MAYAKRHKKPGKHPKVESFDKELRKLESETFEEHEEWWRDDHLSGAFSAFKRTLIIERALELVIPQLKKRTAFCDELVVAMEGALPQKGAGKGTTKVVTADWDTITFNNYLRGGTITPDAEEREAVAEAATGIAIREFGSRDREGAAIDHVLKQRHISPSACLELVLGSLRPAAPETYRARPPFASILGPGFAAEPQAASPAPLEQMANQIHDELRGLDGARLILVAGPHLSGKKTSLRYLCKRFRNGKLLKLESGSHIPVLALALDELAPGDFVDQVFQFFRNGDPSAVKTPEGDEGLTVAAKVEHVQRLCKRQPACVILADVAPMESDELVRSLHHDRVAEIVSHLLSGNHETRVVLTAHDHDKFGPMQEEASRRGIRPEVFRLPRRLLINRDLKFLREASEVDETSSSSFKVSGITYQLAYIAKKLSHLRRKQSGFRLRVERSLANNEDWKILDIVWVDLLEPHERFLLGAVASSFDGLRTSVVVRMAKALAQRDVPWIEMLSTEQKVQEVAQRLSDFVQIGARQLDLGQHGWRKPTMEDLIFMDQGWRTHVMSTWFEHDDDMARECLWLVAREAAEQARTFKTVGGFANARSALARDLQSFDALIASIDPEDCSTDRKDESTWSSEARILPSLDRRDAPRPDAITVLRYAYQRWFTDYLEGADYRLLSELDDPSLRLRLLLPLFDPSRPWLRLADRRLHWEEDGDSERPSDDLYRQIKKAFPGKRLLPLLTGIAMASLRVQRFDLLRTVGRMAEQILDADAAGPDATKAFRILRAEIDAGLYGGGNPDVSLPMRPWEKSERERLLEAPSAGRRSEGEQEQSYDEVVDRITKVLAGRFQDQPDVTAEMVVARAKIVARLGEAYHMMGLTSRARQAFDEVLAAEAKLADKLGDESGVGRILGGRCARASIAFYVDCSRRRQWIKDQPDLRLPNGLNLPLPLIVRGDDEELKRAQDLLALNVRRIGAFDAADRLGVRMDQARLAAARGQYLNAMELLKPTESVRLRPGANIELSMEFCTLHTKTLLEAALLTLRYEAGAPPTDDFWNHIRDLKQGYDTDGAPLVDELVELAEQSLGSFRWLVGSRKALFLPCGMVFRYFEIWLRLLRLRNVDAAEMRHMVRHIVGDLDIVMDHMKAIHFHRFHYEADVLKQRLEAILADPEDTRPIQSDPIVSESMA